MRELRDFMDEVVQATARRQAQLIDDACLRAGRERCGVAVVRQGTPLARVEPLLPECSIVEFPTAAAYARWREDPDRFVPEKPSWWRRRRVRKLVKTMEREGQ